LTITIDIGGGQQENIEVFEGESTRVTGLREKIDEHGASLTNLGRLATI
jgi:hypothetical protein